MGGLIGNAFDIRAPFDIACVSFLLSALYSQFALPYISPETISSGKAPGQKSGSGLLAPLRILMPRKMRLADGRIRKHWGLVFLCLGIGVGVVSFTKMAHRHTEFLLLTVCLHA